MLINDANTYRKATCSIFPVTPLFSPSSPCIMPLSMDTGSNNHMHLRPHHILCLPFLSISPDYVGPDFYRKLSAVKDFLISDGSPEVTCVLGTDEVCRACPWRVGDRCESETIQEDMVRKLDRFLLKECGRSYGETLPVAEWREVVSRHWPYRVCRICRWRSYCGLG